MSSTTYTEWRTDQYSHQIFNPGILVFKSYQKNCNGSLARVQVRALQIIDFQQTIPNLGTKALGSGG